jgi:tetratricopeptide (TPR) repeat protein
MNRSILSIGILLTSLAANAKTPGEIYEQAAKSTVVIRNFDGGGKPQSMGSGVVLPNKDIATNCHVIKNAGQIKIRIDKKEYPALLRYSDWERDVCSLSASGIAAPPIAVGSTKKLKVGARVYAIGAPKGLELSLSEGIVSSLREAKGGRYIQTTAAISPGSSGGGLYDDDGALVGLTTFYLAEGQSLNFALPVEWIEELPKQSKQSPLSDRPETWWMARSSELGEQRKYREWLDHCTRWTEAYPSSAGAWSDLGAAYAELTMYANAIAFFKKSISIDPSPALAWYNLGLTYGKNSQLRDLDKARTALQEAVRLDPEYANAWHQLGNTYIAMRDIDRALDAQRRAIRLNPENANAWAMLANVHLVSGQIEKAFEASQQAIRLAPDSGLAWMALGSVYGTRNQRDKVLEVYKNLKRLDPNSAEQFFDAWVVP